MVTRVVALLVVSLSVAACSRPGAPTIPSGLANAQAPPALHAAGYKTIFTFDGTDGGAPGAGLIGFENDLYGTTERGGKNGCGTVFRLSTAGREQVLHDFGSDGCNALGLIRVKEVFYGVAYSGGADNEGTAFAIKTTGDELWYYSFKGSSDGANPEGALLYAKPNLYGTTDAGGSACKGDGCGTVFKIAHGGKESVLYDFKGDASSEGDGESPYAGLAKLKGTFYGTTGYGGAYDGGSVFSVSTSGKEKILYSFFHTSTDAERPDAPLTVVGNTLYGTSLYGGKYGKGTVYSVSTGGSERVIYSFGSGSDGAYPEARVISVGGELYGTTEAGGSSSSCSGGCGTVFEVSAGGAERVLHSFTGGNDGAAPEAGLLSYKKELYGTTAEGGANSLGTVFALTP